MELSFIYALIGFSLAGLSVFGNDSIQTLGTFIAAKKKWYKWYVLATAASVVLVGTLTYGWVVYDGDITFGRLNKIPYIEIQWYHAVAPLVLVMLTRVGIPVSTTFLVLSAFASTVVLEKVLLKSIVGYAIAASAAYAVWFVVSKYINEKDDEITDPKKQAFWRNSQWIASGFLWATWLMHDVANIAVYLPRKIDPMLFILVMLYFVGLLYYIFWREGGPIQKIVLEKTGTRYARSCTIIDLVYCAVLYFFKELNDLPMSTTWVFVGLLCGRELAIATHHKTNLRKYVFPIIGKDFLKMIFGLAISAGIVLSIHYIIIPNDLV
jgi:phosphate/sulfate permease